MNSLEIYIDPLPSPGVMSAKMWIREGSRADPIHQKGAHQLLGSVLTRGCGPFDYFEIADLIEGCGAGLHCETYEDGFLISLKCLGTDAHRLLPVIGWMLQKPHLETRQIDLERELSIQSLKRQKENPFYLAFDAWRQLAYGASPYGHDPLGAIDDLKLLSKNELIPLSTSLITREKVLVISGTFPIDIEQYINKIEPFDFLLNQDTSDPISINYENSIINRTNKNHSLTLQSIESSQVVIMLGEATVPHGHKDDLLLHLLSCHIGSGMSSQLFIELREKYGVAYDVGVHHPTKEYDSPFLIHASTSNSKSLHTLELLQSCWKDLHEKTISEDELILAKAKYRSQLAHASQTVSQRTERKAHLLGLKLPLNHDQENIKKIESITAEDLQNAANKHLYNPLLSLCGPKHTINKLANKWLANHSYPTKS
tara:strand:- start:1965 stop:3245 length:1281 start_codon:yes stop_codon:yes gene_type:complete